MTRKATGAPKRGAHESAPKPAVRRRRKKKPTSESQNANDKQPGLSYPVMTPEEFFQKIGELRKEAELEIERLIAFLDATVDTDMDASIDDGPIDDDELEPSLSVGDAINQPHAWLPSFDHDLTSDGEIGLGSPEGTGSQVFQMQKFGARDDGEPSLGAAEYHPAACDVGTVVWLQNDGFRGFEARKVQGGDQTVWGWSGTQDLEDEHDGCEPDDEGDELEVEGADYKLSLQDAALRARKRARRRDAVPPGSSHPWLRLVD